MCETSGVSLGPEDGDLVGGRPKRFHTFVGLLAVVKGGRHAVETQVGVGDEGWGGPFSSLDTVVGFDVAVD